MNTTINHDVSQPLIVPPPAGQARAVLNRFQRFTWYGLILCVIVGFILSWQAMLIWINGIVACFYLIVTLYKIMLFFMSSRSGGFIQVTPEEVEALKDEDLPSYTILVPLYKEGGVLPQLVTSLSRIDYPDDKLEILFLLEEDDDETIQAYERMNPPAPFEGLIVKDSYPHTKPKACDVGLARATGERLVIYDAEDRPEPDQLKKAVIGFTKVGQEVACLQARLNFYNRNYNLLARWFTTEYSLWYDLLLPGLSAMDAPIPLGGTSNHFLVDKLREVGGWDPYNVAEDCDLGIRLYRQGYRTHVLNSTTWEEACSQTGYWIRQRSRWIKGYMQSFLVHTRQPVKTMSQLGIGGTLHFILLTLGMFMANLVNPFYWFLTVLWILFRTESVGEYFPATVFILAFFCLFVGNYALIYANMLGCCKRGYYHLVKYALIIPPYWALLSVAAWKAAWQLIVKPHYWEKTQHGLDTNNPLASDLE